MRGRWGGSHSRGAVLPPSLVFPLLVGRVFVAVGAAVVGGQGMGRGGWEGVGEVWGLIGLLIDAVSGGRSGT